ncbi:MAG: hypothetical protein PVG51_10015 [Desulfosarcina sp.]|jgi:hypothetical protein
MAETAALIPISDWMPARSDGRLGFTCGRFSGRLLSGNPNKRMTAFHADKRITYTCTGQLAHDNRIGTRINIYI